MTDDELDGILSAKIKRSLAGKSLPDAFSARLAASVRRSAKTYRLKMAAAALAGTCSVCAILGLAAARPARNAPQGAVAAYPAQNSTPAEEISQWGILGVLRECFRRPGRPRRRKEAESIRFTTTRKEEK